MTVGVALYDYDLYDDPHLAHGQAATLSLTTSCGGHFAVCVSADGKRRGNLPCELGITLAEKYLLRGRPLRCWVESAGIEEPPLSDSCSGVAWIDVTIAGVVASKRKSEPVAKAGV